LTVAGRRISRTSPDVRERLDAIGFVPVANAPDEFAAVIKAESERWAKVTRAANIKAEP
jgi:tripartite-type tricarboxylate transporter receptor subunit TctC